MDINPSLVRQYNFDWECGECFATQSENLVYMVEPVQCHECGTAHLLDDMLSQAREWFSEEVYTKGMELRKRLRDTEHMIERAKALVSKFPIVVKGYGRITNVDQLETFFKAMEGLIESNHSMYMYTLQLEGKLRVYGYEATEEPIVDTIEPDVTDVIP